MLNVWNKVKDFAATVGEKIGVKTKRAMLYIVLAFVAGLMLG